jgi:hypothetical protein|tara:strand:- start:149480 stop:150361 length:882 start_codon:yes stop_codon:yes gene_type:complete
MPRILAALSACLLAASANAQTPRLPDADPALFRVADDDTTIWLFGTIHMLDGKSSWFDEAIRDAFDESSELVLETVEPDAATSQQVVLEKAIDLEGPTLSESLPAATMAALSAELSRGGIPLAAVEPMDPWMAALTLVQLQYQRLGLRPESGAEELLKRAAAETGKPVSGLEDFEWQLDLFDTMPEEAQIAFLQEGIEELANAETFIAEMVAAWNAGDMKTLSGLMNEGLQANPDLRRRLLTQRNANWAAWIQDRLETPGTVFVAVGAGHLGGEDSVQAQLKTLGIDTVRVDY